MLSPLLVVFPLSFRFPLEPFTLPDLHSQFWWNEFPMFFLESPRFSEDVPPALELDNCIKPKLLWDESQLAKFVCLHEDGLTFGT